MQFSYINYGTVNVFEIIWTLIGVVGLYYCMKNIRDVNRSIHALHEMDGKTFEAWNRMQIIAGGHFRNEVFRILISSMFIAVGTIAMLLPSVTPHKPVSPLMVVISLAFFVIEAIVVSASVMDNRQREILIKGE